MNISDIKFANPRLANFPHGTYRLTLKFHDEKDPNVATLSIIIEGRDSKEKYRGPKRGSKKEALK